MVAVTQPLPWINVLNQSHDLSQYLYRCGDVCCVAVKTERQHWPSVRLTLPNGKGM